MFFFIYLFPHLLCSACVHLFLFVVVFDSCVWFGGLVFVSMLDSAVRDLKAVLMPYLLHILLNFSDMSRAYGIIADPVGFSCMA